jgi:hypothetical protein
MKKMILALLLVVMSACSRHKDNEEIQPNPTLTLYGFITDTPRSSFSVEERLQIEQDHEQLRQLYEQIAVVWDGLSRNEDVQCGAEIQTISPERFENVPPVYSQLRRAAVELFDAVELWKGECANPRETVPETVIDRGVLRVRGAEDALRIVEELLSNN